MGASGRSEIEFDAEMKIHCARDEPDAFALGHLRRFGDFSEAEDPGIEAAGAVFARDRNGDLDVIDVEDWHNGSVLELCSKADRAWRRWILRIFSGRPLRRGGGRVRRRGRTRGGVLRG